MRVSVCILFLVFLSFAYTLEELVDSAYVNSGHVQNSQLFLKNNLSEKKEIRSRLMPRIFLNGEVEKFGKSSDRYALETNASGISEEYVKGSKAMSRIPDQQDLLLAGMMDTYAVDRSLAPKTYGVELGLSFEQPIFQQGKVITDMRINRLKGSMLICQWQDVHMNVKSTVSKYFYGLLLAQENIKIVNSFKEFSLRKHEIARIGFESGELLAIDTLRTFIEVKQAEESVFDAEQNKLFAEIALKRFTGLDTVSDFTVEGVLEPIEYNLEYDSALVRVENENKTVTRLRGEVDLADLNLEMTKRQFLPEVFAGFNLSRVSDFNSSEYFSFEPERRIFLGLKQELFSSGQRYFAVRQAEYKQEIAQNIFDDNLRELQIELKKRWQSRELQHKKLERSKIIIAAAEEGYTVASELFRSGTISLSSLNDLEQKLKQAQLDYIKAVYNYNCSVVELRRLTADYLYN